MRCTYGNICTDQMHIDTRADSSSSDMHHGLATVIVLNNLSFLPLHGEILHSKRSTTIIVSIIFWVEYQPVVGWLGWLRFLVSSLVTRPPPSRVPRCGHQRRPGPALPLSSSSSHARRPLQRRRAPRLPSLLVLSPLSSMSPPPGEARAEPAAAV